MPRASSSTVCCASGRCLATYIYRSRPVARRGCADKIALLHVHEAMINVPTRRDLFDPIFQLCRQCL